MDNNEVYALFEDIRNGLKGINDGFGSHKGLVRQFRKGASATNQSHADQVRRGGG